MAKKAKKTVRGKRPKSVLAKAWATRRAKAAGVIADELSPRAEAQAVNAVRDDWNRVRQSKASAASSAATDVVDRENAQVNEIMKLARKRGGDILVMAKLGEIEQAARMEAERAVADFWSDRLRDLQQRRADDIVCGFVAEIMHLRSAPDGMPNGTTHVVANPTINAVVDALYRAGYAPAGRTRGAAGIEKREALMEKTHNEVFANRR